MSSCISFIPQLFIAFACVFYGLAGVASASSAADSRSSHSQRMHAADAFVHDDTTARK